MSELMEALAATMRADADALRVIGQNIANAEVVAYRRQIPVQAMEFNELVDSAARSIARPPMHLDSDVAVDMRAGTLRTTGEPLHVAIEGSGFFVLQSPAGLVFTRRGDLRVSADGMLIAASGEIVLGTNGPIHVGAGVPIIGTDGTVRVGADMIDQLQLVHPADESALQYLGNGLYAAVDDVPATGEGHSIVHQGVLETSNVTPVAEMVQLMETMRHFEAAQRFVRGYDDMMQKAISELGRTR